MKRCSQEQHQSRFEAIKESLRLRSANIVSRTVKRSSAQRITLFKYDNVRIFNGEMFVPTKVPGPKSESRKYYSPNLGESIGSKKPLTLLALGPIEIYEIKTNKSCSKYLTVGKRDSNLIHPLLPRLRIVKYDSIQYCYFVAFSNPSRFWRIEFLDTGQQGCNLDRVTEEFETVIRGVCQLLEIESSSVQELAGYSEFSSGNLDELNYLLDDSDDDFGEWYKERLANIRGSGNRLKGKGRDSVFLVEFSNQKVLVHKSVNAEFQKVMSHLRRPLDIASTDCEDINWTSDAKSNISQGQSTLNISSVASTQYGSHLKISSSSSLSDQDTLVSAKEHW